MKKLYFLLFFVFSLTANAQIINFPDANFKAKLLNATTTNFYASTSSPTYSSFYNNWSGSTSNIIDTNGDGEIQVSEAQAIKCLNLKFSNISSLSGIEYFTNLQSLRVDNNNLMTLDVSQNTALINLRCELNNINSLNVSNCSLLQDLHCFDNNLYSLDITQCTSLKRLYCNLNNLSSLDLSQSSLIEIIYCMNNQIVNLDLSQCPLINNLHCEINALNSLNLSGCSVFESLDCHGNYITNLDLSSCTSIGYIRCEYNDLTNLNLPNSSNAYFLDCSYNELTTLDVSGLPSLATLNCHYNLLTSIDVSGLSLLTRLYCRNNLLTSLDVSQCFLLDELYCRNNNLEVLNIKNGNTNWVSIDFNNNPTLLYVCADDEDISLVQSYIYSYPNCHVNTYCTFTPGGIFYEISGTTKFDFNNDGCDTTDFDYKNLSFSISDGNSFSSIVSNQTGNYYIPVGTGAFTITPTLENPTYFNISPPSFVVDFPTDASPFTQDFCVTANGVHSDVEVIVMPTTSARPGFDANYKIVYKNKGNQVENGNVSLTFDDSVLDYLSSNPVYDSSATNSFTWNYTNLQPFESREIEISFNVNSPTETPAVNIDDVLNYAATISTANTDETPDDNTFALNQTVVGSYDPNDKTCLEGEYVSSSVVGKYVHYVIRFENTGTYPAENIVVKDIIDTSKFDVSTLVPLHGSHEFFTRIKDNKVEFIFENINLDFNDATNDGYVAFKIKTLPSLTVGDTFSNDANIYFDYNFPITTNEYITTIDNLLNNQDFAFENEFVMYPNPTKDILNISTKNQTEIQSVEIYNIVGQVVIAIPNTAKTIDVSSLETGTYFVKLNTEKGSTTTKFVKE